MLLKSGMRSLGCMAFAVSASPFTGAENQISDRSLPSNVSHVIPSLILPTPPSNISAKNALNIKCDGAQYGDNLNVTDCKDARDYIGSGPHQFPWVKRTHFFRRPHFWLPYRYMGGTLSKTISRSLSIESSFFAKSEQISDTVISRWA